MNDMDPMFWVVVGIIAYGLPAALIFFAGYFLGRRKGRSE